MDPNGGLGSSSVTLQCYTLSTTTVSNLQHSKDTTLCGSSAKQLELLKSSLSLHSDKEFSVPKHSTEA